VVELNDSLVDLDSNLQSLQSIQESLVSFNESFSSFLYGLQINAYTVEFNELPGLNDATIQRNEEVKEKITKLENFFYERGRESNEGNETYMTNDEDGSFLVQPTKRKSTAAPSIRDHRDSRKSRIPVGRRVATKSDTSSARGTAPGGVLKPTVASERRQRPPVQNNTRPPFR
jgi:DASH complex subunit DAM1